MVLTTYQRGIDRKKVEEVIGHSLKTTEQVHHHTDGTLVVCEDQAYHMLLHRRTRALKACGHANWLRCKFCGEYDNPINLKVYRTNKGGFSIYHSDCMSEYNRERYQRNKSGGNNEAKC